MQSRSHVGETCVCRGTYFPCAFTSLEEENSETGPRHSLISFILSHKNKRCLAPSSPLKSLSKSLNAWALPFLLFLMLFLLPAGTRGGIVPYKQRVGVENWCQLSRARKLIQGTISSKVNGRTDLQHSINWIKLKAISYALVAITPVLVSQAVLVMFYNTFSVAFTIRKEKRVSQFCS